MKIALQVLAFHISDHYPDIFEFYPDASNRLDRVYPLSLERSFNKHSAYVAKWCTLWTCDPLPANIICIGGGVEAYQFFQGKSSNAVIIPSDVDIESILQITTDTIAQYNDYEREIQDAIIHDANIDEILSIVSTAFENPAWITDAALRVIGASTPNGSESQDGMWRNTIQTGISSQQVVAIMKDAGLLQQLDTSNKAMFVNCPPVEPFICSNFFHDNDRVASLTIAAASNRLDKRLLPVADYITKMLEIVVFRQGNAYYLQSSNLQKMMLDMLGGAMLDRKVLQHNLSGFRWNIYDEFQVIKVEVDQVEVNSGTMKYIQELVKKIFQDSVYIDFQDTFLLVLHRSGHVDIDTKINSDFRILIEKRKCKAGFSMRYYDFSLLNAAYELAGVALEKGKIITRDLSIYRYEDYFMAHLIDLCAISIDIISLCSPEAMRLYKYDVEHGTDYLKSLYMYITEEKRIAAAARKLNIHRNTLVYRLSRIREICSVDLEDSAQRFHIMWSYQTLHHLHS